VHGPHRAQHVQQFAETLRRTTGIRPADIRVTEGADGFARLHYGKYSRRTDPKTGRRSMPTKMREDLNLLKQLGDASGRRYFLEAMPVRMPTPDVGNPEWVLVNVPATYSLQVAAFEPTDDFWEYKRAAAEFCKFLRQKGYEAYYHHTSASSIVTVGAFGPGAVRTGSDGRTYYSPAVLALQQNELLKYNLVNGSIYRIRNDRGTTVPVPSRLVVIPRNPGDASE
jgi:hypothetical protein